MSAKKKDHGKPLTGAALIKETCRRIRLARSYWDAHRNPACRGERAKAMALYESLSDAEREKVPQVLRVWLRYRSEKYFGPSRTPPGKKEVMSRSALKEGLHPRNRFRNRYDFSMLIECHPALAAFVAQNAHGDDSINYGNADAVKALNQALLKHGYDLSTWDIPPGYLCPAIPGRSDYLHHLADLLAARSGTVPRGSSVTVLDIGVGANCIYPLIGACEYGWRFVGSEIDPVALRWAKNLVAANGSIADLIECRLQPSPLECFNGVVGPDETFDLSMCNPPFHASAGEAAMGNQRRSRNLTGNKAIAGNLSFGGKAGELWCPGGELAFLQRMISQSAALHHRCRWFTTLVSKSEHLSHLQQSLKHAKVLETKIIEMAQGNKKTRILAWTFMRPAGPFIGSGA